MNLFVKKLLAKYVKYIEIIGYLFVLLFIAGLIALSQIKAEDEFVPLNGKLEIRKKIFSFSQKQIILNLFFGSSEKVQFGDKLFELTNDKKYIADREIIKKLKTQIKSAREVSDIKLADKFSVILSEMKSRAYPNLEIRTVQSGFAGTFFPFVKKYAVTGENESIGGVFDFENCSIIVTEFPADNQQKKKLKSGQTGTASLNLGFENSTSFPVQMTELRDNEMIFKPVELSLKNKQKIAVFFTRQNDVEISVSLSVLVGSKSWMNLIWR